MFKALREYLIRLLLAPLAAHFRAQAAIEAAECKADILRRAQQAEEDKQPELARQLREYAGTLGIDGNHADEMFTLPAPSANGHAALPAPSPKKIGRPKKEHIDEAQR